LQQEFFKSTTSSFALASIDKFVIMQVMNKTVRIIVIVVILILLGGGAFYLFSKSHKASTQSEQTAAPQNQSQQMSTQKKSLADFFSMTGSLKCTFSDNTDNSSGTVYVAVGKMRGDFQRTDSGKTHASHMINDGQFVYYWTDGEKTGYKMSLASVKNEMGKAMGNAMKSSGGDQSQQQGPDMKKQSNYSCGPWAADKTLFTPPTDVTFTDYTSMMQGAMKSIPTSNPKEGMNAEQKQNACAACNQVPAGAMRTQCLTQLKCQ